MVRKKSENALNKAEETNKQPQSLDTVREVTYLMLRS